MTSALPPLCTCLAYTRPWVPSPTPQKNQKIPCSWLCVGNSMGRGQQSKSHIALQEVTFHSISTPAGVQHAKELVEKSPWVQPVSWVCEILLGGGVGGAGAWEGFTLEGRCQLCWELSCHLPLRTWGGTGLQATAHVVGVQVHTWKSAPSTGHILGCQVCTWLDSKAALSDVADRLIQGDRLTDKAGWQ